MYKIEISKKSVDALIHALLFGRLELERQLKEVADKSTVIEYSSILARIEDIQEQLNCIYLQIQKDEEQEKIENDEFLKSTKS